MCTHTHTHTHTNTHTYTQTYTHSRTRNPTLNPPTPILPLNYKLTKDGLPQPSRQGEEQQKETNEKVYLRILSLKQCQLATPIAKAKKKIRKYQKFPCLQGHLIKGCRLSCLLRAREDYPMTHRSGAHAPAQLPPRPLFPSTWKETYDFLVQPRWTSESLY